MSHKQVVRRWFDEVWNKHDASAIDRMFAKDRVSHGLAPDGQDLVGPERFRSFHQRFLNAFPDLQIVIDDLVEEDDRVAARWHCSGTLTGAGLGVAPNGRRMSVAGMSLVVVHNGAVVEAWNTFDMFGMHRQLGTLAAIAAAEPV
jgi:steroid delta-isomerase-like uncharacterized protein